MSSYAYDIEVFPNFFSIIFVDLHSEDSFTIYKLNDEYSESIANYNSFYETITSLVGYNNLEFDDVLLKAFNQGQSNQQLYKTTQKIIESEKKQQAKLGYLTVDLYKILHHDAKGISLKQCAINMQWPKIQDFPLHHESIISENQIEEILQYNLNDVLITKKLFFRILPEINLRIDVGANYNVNVINKSRAGVGDKLMEKLYADATGLEPRRFRYLSTKRQTVHFKDCISDKIVFQTDQLKHLLDDLKTIEIQCLTLNEE